MRGGQRPRERFPISFPITRLSDKSSHDHGVVDRLPDHSGLTKVTGLLSSPSSQFITSNDSAVPFSFYLGGEEIDLLQPLAKSTHIKPLLFFSPKVLSPT